MHKELQESVCFGFHRRAEDRDAAESITLGDIALVMLLFVDAYALDAAARQLAVYVIAPLCGWK